MTDRWHFAIIRALRQRPPLAWAYDNDTGVHECLRQLNVALLALDQAMDQVEVDGHTQRQVLARFLANPDVLPTDEVLLRRRYDHERRLRELTMQMPGVPGVHLDDQGRGVSPPLMVYGWTRRCPECQAGKHGNCTGEALDLLDQLAPCTCTDPAHHGRRS